MTCSNESRLPLLLSVRMRPKIRSMLLRRPSVGIQQGPPVAATMIRCGVRRGPGQTGQPSRTRRTDLGCPMTC
jgi:hypothetical protein